MQINNPSSGGGTSAPQIPYSPLTSAGWYSTLYSGSVITAPATASITANLARIYPISISKAMTVSPLIRVTASAAGNIVVSIYSPDPVTGLPGPLVKTFAQISTAANGTIQSVDSQLLQPGQYFVFFNGTGTATTNRWAGNTFIPGGQGVTAGYMTFASNFGGCFEGTVAYTATPPNPNVLVTANTGTSFNSPVFFAIT